MTDGDTGIYQCLQEELNPTRNKTLSVVTATHGGAGPPVDVWVSVCGGGDLLPHPPLLHSLSSECVPWLYRSHMGWRVPTTKRLRLFQALRVPRLATNTPDSDLGFSTGCFSENLHEYPGSH